MHYRHKQRRQPSVVGIKSAHKRLCLSEITVFGCVLTRYPHGDLSGNSQARTVVVIEGQLGEMEVDSGSDFPNLTEETFHSLQHCNNRGLALADFPPAVVDFQMQPVMLSVRAVYYMCSTRGSRVP